jgi:hypothetical protein
MNTILLIFFVVLLIVPFIFFQKIHERILDDRVKKRAFDGNEYLVRKTDRSQETADALARLNKTVMEFIMKLDQNLPMVQRLKRRYNPKALSEGRIDVNYTSYTINKGESVTLCMRTRDQRDQLYNDNVLLGVLLHELAHIASVGLHHNEEFTRNFNYLLTRATDLGIFKRINEQVEYCNMYTTI